ncbi:related to CAT2 - Carnitine O-acetyltransferase [Moesziomyces antarcticus]|uniref:Related to CAT2 - Carnitine O-acetyltransferase n=2 Tax=Pseudozyma antarctica TaxID=84753 RepID=A0A5C3FHJ7_PSEA2|nr:related to CAT2 - Carnitine O-acetyltransferase [Moesziomyces antarcticus]
MLLSRQRKGLELLSTGRIIPLRPSYERVPVPTPRLAPSSRTFHASSPAMFALTPWRGAPGTQPKTFSQQRNMPRLPVPSLEQTFDKYLKSLSPFLRQLEEQGKLEGSTAEKELAKRKQWISEFLATGGLGPKLQQRLIDVDRTTENNWLDDRWWLQKAYHEWRVPLMINSNWWLMFTHDKNMPADLAEHSGHDAYPVTGLGSQNWNDAAWGIRRAAWLTSRFLQFKKRLDDEDIMPDSSRAGPFCMHQYTRLYGVTRIPALPHDWNTATPHPAVARHITVIARDNYYELEVVRKDGTLLGIDTLEKALWDIVADAQKGDGAGVGVLSSDNRDTWTKTREHLLSVSPVNRKSINSVEDSLLCLSLDSSVLALSADHPAPAHESTPVWVDALARNCSGAGRGGHNRWFDKALSIVVEPNGRAGIMGEHSPCDALIPSILCDYAAAESCPPPGTNVPAELSSPNESAAWSKLEWTVDESTQKSIAQSEAAALQAAKESDIRTLWYDEYGADWIKKVGKHSPDAYLQMALQLAYAKAHGQQVSTYETASTRLFKHGRTDVIRSFSDEAYEFVRGVREGKDAKKLYALLTAATKSHNTQTRESSTGKGIDRHMTGLRLLLRAEDGETPAVFSDPLFAESQSWRLSTSGLSAGDRFAGTGFGTGYPTESYGINYLAGAQLLKFGIESKHNATTNFARCLVEALRDMRRICEHGGPPPEATQTPKL